MTSVAPIRPELLAAKFEKVGNFEEPRLLDEFGSRPEFRQILCYLQHVSQPRNYAGGLSRFAADLIDASAEFIGTEAMRKAAPKGNRYSLDDATAVFRGLTEGSRHHLCGLGDSASNCCLFENAFLYDETFAPEDDCFDAILGRASTRPEPLSKATLNQWRRELEPFFLDTVTPERVKDVCVQEARSNLAEYLKEVCELPHVGLLPRREITVRKSGADSGYAPWYFIRVTDALIAFIDKRGHEQRSMIAETAVTKSIDNWIGKSRRMGTAVMVIGNSRFGKSEAIEAEAAARPGHCRIVQTPSGNALRDLLREVAKAIGIEVGPQTNGRALAESIDYVLRHLRLQLIFDEAQFLLPANYSRNSAPARLNWYRRTVMDQKIPSILVCTPQSYMPAKRRFEKATGFAMEQFEERIDKVVELPTELDEADLLAIAGIHLPDVSKDYLEYVVKCTIATERNFVSDLAKIARHARDYAQENGRQRPILSDINAAITDLLPASPAPSLQFVKTRKAAPLQRPCTPTAVPSQVAGKPFEVASRFVRQSLTPAGMT